jgi:hypothetical protein
MTTPKVACSTVKLALHALEGLPQAAQESDVHDMGQEMQLAAFSLPEIATILDSPKWLRFAFVRNPYDRLFSAWKDKVTNPAEPYYHPLHERLGELYGPTRQDSAHPPLAFRNFVDFVLDGPDDPWRFDAHWAVQVDLLWFDLIDFDVVGRFETFSSDFARILARLNAPQTVLQLARKVTNATAKIPLAAAYDQPLATRVFEHYRRDFTAFDYPPDSWMYL